MNLQSANTEAVIGIIPEFRPMMVAKEYESYDGSKPLNPSKSIYNISQVRISGCEYLCFTRFLPPQGAIVCFSHELSPLDATLPNHFWYHLTPEFMILWVHPHRPQEA